MSRYERRMYFESLCQLRDRYGERTADDSAAVMSIEAAIVWAEAELLLAPAPEPMPADEPAA